MNKKILKKVQENPQVWFEETLGVDSLLGYHEQILKDVANHDRVAIAACHALGKTWIMARIVLWFLYCFKGAKVITTAPTNRQVEKLLWGEIGVAVERAPYNLGGHLTNKELKISKDWYAMGFSPQKSAGGGDDSTEQKGSSFQGWHGDYILIVFDEAVGVPPDVWTQVEGLLTSGKIVKFVCIANPTTKNCDFYDLFSLPSWKKVYLSCFDSPNLQANGISNLDELKKELETLTMLEENERLDRIKNYKKPVSHLISCQWVMEKALEWGVDDARFQAKVLGIFPDVDDTVLIQSASVKKAQDRTHDAKEKKGTRYIGIDVARFGDDKSVFTELMEPEQKIVEVLDENGKKTGQYYAGPVHTRTKKTGKKDLMETTGNAVRFIMDDYEGEKVIVCIDATGMGSGVLDRLLELQRDKELPRSIRFVEVHFGQAVKNIQKNKKKPTKKELLEQKTHHNIKSLMFDDLAQALKNELRLRKDNTYNSQLPTIKYTFTSNGKQIVESKKDYKKRTGKPSPDESDSLALANFARRFEAYGAYLKRMLGNG